MLVAPTPLGFALNRVEIKGNNAVYHITTLVHNNGAHWLLAELSGEAGVSSQMVSINTNDDTDGNPQKINMGNIKYPKDVCFTLSVYGYLSKPKKKDESCGTPVKSGVICAGDFPGL